MVPFSELNKKFVIQNTSSKYTADLEELQILCFPELVDSERMKKKHYEHHLTIFPEGQFLILDIENDKAIASTTTIRYNYDLSNPKLHTFSEIFNEGWLNTHQKDGNWLYGIDVSVHPSYRKNGFGRMLYKIRHKLVKELNLDGQLIFGMFSGFSKFNSETGLKIDDYFNLVKENKIFDPTVSMQMKIGAELIGKHENYLNDSLCQGHVGVLVIRETDKIR